MKGLSTKKSALMFLCIGVAAFSLYTLFVVLWPMGGGILPSGEVEIPDMPSYDLPVSDIFKVKAGDLFLFKVDIERNVTLVGNFSEASGLCFNFHVLNESNMKKLLTYQELSAYVEVHSEGPEKQNFNFTTNQKGTYYFAFDNRETPHGGGVCLDVLIFFELMPQE